MGSAQHVSHERERKQRSNYHERFLRPKYVRNIETHLQAIAPDLYDGLYEQVKAKVLAYISELADHQNKPVIMMLVRAGMVKTIGRRRTNQGSARFFD